ncbi:hypothetical protein B0T19DRAFT_22432 [Cercophora scortea]|uniref:Uncharacterized protein n=1 Tax=Cercophora scortea TaxID=314031 RepID=A0AAE0MKW3_9PEZI|nr:hypothetical protein B0T19DRAFT_22432 [Cercophora scortea]
MLPTAFIIQFTVVSHAQALNLLWKTQGRKKKTKTQKNNGCALLSPNPDGFSLFTGKPEPSTNPTHAMSQPWSGPPSTGATHHPPIHPRPNGPDGMKLNTTKEKDSTLHTGNIEQPPRTTPYFCSPISTSASISMLVPNPLSHAAHQQPWMAVRGKHTRM